MNLYKITSLDRFEYETFDAFIVAAETEESAKNFHPNGRKANAIVDTFIYDGWTDNFKVEYLGTATKGTKEGVVLASYNPG